MSIKISINNLVKEYPTGTALLEISHEYEQDFVTPLVAATVNGAEKSLLYPLEKDANVKFIPLQSAIGLRIYARSLLFVLQIVLERLGLNSEFDVKSNLQNSIYCKLDLDAPADANLIKVIKKSMQDIIHQDAIIEYHSASKNNACAALKATCNASLINFVELIEPIKQDTISYYKCLDSINYFFSPLVPSTGYLKVFDVMAYRDGVLIQFPEMADVHTLQPYVDRPKLATTYTEAEDWAELIGCRNISDLNKKIKNNEFDEIISVSEALHEKKISEIAAFIAKQLDTKRLILIAGPSSSGKTTTAERLRIHLRVNGINPVSISVDDYFLNREQTPRDEQGNYDFENIHALDLPLFNEHLRRILDGERVKLPTFNFIQGCREYRGNSIQINEHQPIIIEGIHALNDQLTADIDLDKKLKVYVSAITGIAFNNYNRIPTTDCRLIRRIVRDSQFRSHDALQTLRMWPSVRAGEEKNIFPYQEDADIVFNTSLIYELAVLKQYATKLLEVIDCEQPEYSEAVRLLNLLGHVQELDHFNIPDNSILKEFIGK